MNKLIFKEEQSFTQRWIWVLIGCTFLIPMIFIVIELVESSDAVELIFPLAIIAGTGLVIIWLFLKMKLYVEITQNEIRFRFPPFLNKWKSINKIEIERFEVRTYKPVWEYGGWGIKGNTRNKAYNVKGNIGLQIYLKDSKKVLFGTQHKQAIRLAMERMMNSERKE
jgi:hypothetical protein